MLNVKFTSRFKRDYKLIKRQGKDIGRLEDVIPMGTCLLGFVNGDYVGDF